MSHAPSLVRLATVAAVACHLATAGICKADGVSQDSGVDPVLAAANALDTKGDTAGACALLEKASEPTFDRLFSLGSLYARSRIQRFDDAERTLYRARHLALVERPGVVTAVDLRNQQLAKVKAALADLQRYTKKRMLTVRASALGETIAIDGMGIPPQDLGLPIIVPSGLHELHIAADDEWLEASFSLQPLDKDQQEADIAFSDDDLLALHTVAQQARRARQAPSIDCSAFTQIVDVYARLQELVSASTTRLEAELNLAVCLTNAGHPMKALERLAAIPLKYVASTEPALSKLAWAREWAHTHVASVMFTPSTAHKITLDEDQNIVPGQNLTIDPGHHRYVMETGGTGFDGLLVLGPGDATTVDLSPGIISAMASAPPPEDPSTDPDCSKPQRAVKVYESLPGPLRKSHSLVMAELQQAKCALAHKDIGRAKVALRTAEQDATEFQDAAGTSAANDFRSELSNSIGMLSFSVDSNRVRKIVIDGSLLQPTQWAAVTVMSGVHEVDAYDEQGRRWQIEAKAGGGADHVETVVLPPTETVPTWTVTTSRYLLPIGLVGALGFGLGAAGTSGDTSQALSGAMYGGLITAGVAGITAICLIATSNDTMVRPVAPQ
jgi:hypothetical protein